MALTLGTNCGFVTTAPTSDPAAAEITLDNYSWAMEHIAPATASISEIGFYIGDGDDQEVTIFVGIYSDDDTNSEPADRLGVEFVTPITMSVGWHSIPISYSITEGTKYWIAISCSDTGTAVKLDYYNSGGQGSAYKGATPALPEDWGSSTSKDSNGLAAIYALYSAEGGTNMKVDIGNAWKDVSAAKINIGGAWKDVTGAQINVGNSWKTIF